MKDIQIHYGKWEVISEGPKSRTNQRRFLCRCACGKERLIFLNNLRSGLSTQCHSCAMVENHQKRKYKRNGRSGEPLFHVWYAMMSRCFNERDRAFKNYGGRGIAVCERWTNPDLFIQDVSPKPRGQSLHRINNDGNYEPGNCKWATSLEQGSAKINSKYLRAEGRVLHISQWARELGYPRQSLFYHYNRGWTGEEIVRHFRRKGPLPQYSQKVVDRGCGFVQG